MCTCIHPGKHMTREKREETLPNSLAHYLNLGEKMSGYCPARSQKWLASGNPAETAGGKPSIANNGFLWEHTPSFHEQKDTHTQCSISLGHPIFITFPCNLLVQVQALNAKLIHYVLSGAKCCGHLVWGQSASTLSFLELQLGSLVHSSLVPTTQGHLSTEAFDDPCIATLSRAL